MYFFTFEAPRPQKKFFVSLGDEVSYVGKRIISCPDSDPNMQIISDPTGSGSATLPTSCFLFSPSINGLFPMLMLISPKYF